jgi:hypothetical protein
MQSSRLLVVLIARKSKSNMILECSYVGCPAFSSKDAADEWY